MSIDNISAKIVGALARHGFSMLGGLLVAEGLATNDQAMQIEGAGVAVVSIVWTVIAKVLDRRKAETAIVKTAAASASAGQPVPVNNKGDLIDKLLARF